MTTAATFNLPLSHTSLGFSVITKRDNGSPEFGIKIPNSGFENIFMRDAYICGVHQCYVRSVHFI